MTQLQVRAIAQKETVIDQVYREVFANKDGCRFTLEFMTSDKRRFNHKLHAVSKQLAMHEAEQRIQELVSKNTNDSILYRIVSESEKTQWTFASLTPVNVAEQATTNSKIEKSRWNRFVDYFFDLGEEDNE